MKFIPTADSDVGLVKETNQDSVVIKHARFQNEEINDNGLNGYLPVRPKEWKDDDRNLSETKKISKISDIKESQLISVLSRLNENNVKVVIVDSPIYRSMSDDEEPYKRLREICKSMNVAFLDNTHLDGFYGNKEMFSDARWLMPQKDMDAAIFRSVFEAKKQERNR